MNNNNLELTHINSNGEANMVNISKKTPTLRKAIASGYIRLSSEAYSLVKKSNIKKGDVIGVARIAGIMSAKKTSDLIPLCHQINLNSVDLNFEYIDNTNTIKVISTVETFSNTGVEMEALTSCSISLLTIYDMTKAISKSHKIYDISLDYKEGGKSGIYER